VNLGPPDGRVFLELYGTGIRQRPSNDGVSAIMNGVGGPVVSAAQGTRPGLDQVNVQVPRNLAGAGNVGIVITVEGQAASTVMVTIQ